MTYAGEGTILSSGYDFEIYAWDITSATHLKPTLVLHGHRSSILKVIAHSTDIISVDIEGNCRWWDISGRFEQQDMCMQLFRMKGDSFVPQDVVMTVEATGYASRALIV